jgi:peptide chain release factor 3
VLAAVGPMQFEVATFRLETEFGVKVKLDHLPYEIAAITDAAGREILRTESNVEVMTRVRDGALLAVFPHRWRMRTIAGRHPDLRLDAPMDTGQS